MSVGGREEREREKERERKREREKFKIKKIFSVAILFNTIIIITENEF